ncbi:MAG TPA: lipopolysaccharide biosynthesis protein [Micromonosporaceae bacterium]
MNPTTTSAFSAALRRNWWLLCAGLVAGVCAGAVVAAHSDPVYVSSTSILVQPIGTEEINMRTEAEVAKSTDVAAAAGALFSAGADADRIGPIRSELLRVDSVPNTSVLVMRYEAASALAARAGARAFAAAYLSGRAKAARASIGEQASALATTINQLNSQLTSINAQLGNLPPGSAQVATLRGSAATTEAQIAGLTTRLNNLQTTTINPGRVIQQADLPTRPARPNVWLHLLTGATLGMGLGALLGIGNERLTRHVRRGDDLARRTGVPVLAVLSAQDAQAAILPSQNPGGRRFNRLRNEVTAAMAGTDQIILVTGASPGHGSTLVAANLAAALARADAEVILVGANVPELGGPGVPLSMLFDVGDIPGLSDVLSGRASLNRTLQRAPRAPRLRVVTPGGTASAAGLLQSEGVRTALRALASQARYVVIEAPSTATSADAQSLAGIADAAIVVAEAGLTQHAEVVDAAEQLRLMGTRVLGAVLLPRVVRPRDDHGYPPSLPGGDDAAARAADVWHSGNTDAVVIFAPDALEVPGRVLDDEPAAATTVEVASRGIVRGDAASDEESGWPPARRSPAQARTAAINSPTMPLEILRPMSVRPRRVARAESDADT